MKLISWALIGVYGVFFSIFMVKEPVENRRKKDREKKYEEPVDVAEDTAVSTAKKNYYEHIYNKSQ